MVFIWMWWKRRKGEKGMLKGNSKYCYEDGTLINKFDIHDKTLLDNLTRDITTYRIAQLNCGQNVIVDFFDVNSYLNLHKFLFSDVFYFAGEIRDEVIYKSNVPYYSDEYRKTSIFATPNNIISQLKNYFHQMKSRIHAIKSRDDLLDYLSYYYGEINVIHPFREGNGRTLRTYLKLLVDYLNQYFPSDMEFQELDYSLWDSNDRDDLLKATIICNVTGDCSLIRSCFDKVLVVKQERERLKRK